MTIDYRALCKELTNELHGYASANPYHDSDELVARARAALAAEPVPPVDGEAKTLRELALKELDAWSEERNGPGESIICDGLAVRLIRDALAASPWPHADGEVAELVVLIREGVAQCIEDFPKEAGMMTRAADLLERLAPQPVLEGPSDEEILEWANSSDSPVPEECLDPDMADWQRCFTSEEFCATVRAALEEWGHAPNA